MAGKFGWMTKDVMIDFPRAFRRDAAKGSIEESADEHAHVK